MAVIRLSPGQEHRDRCGLRTICAACGCPETRPDPLVIVGDGYRVHLSHVLSEGDGYYGVPFSAEAGAA